MPQAKGLVLHQLVQQGCTSLLCFMMALATTSCKGDMADIERFERQSPADQTMRHARIHRTESGRMQMELKAPFITKYSEPSPRTLYPQGVDVQFYDADNLPSTFLHAGQAVSYDDRNILMGSDSVVVIDYKSGDTVYLQDIVWRQDDDVIFSNHPVKAVNGSRVTYGDGFSTDQRMSNLRVYRQRGTIEINE